MVVNVESRADGEHSPRRSLRLDATAEAGQIRSWNLCVPEEKEPIATSNERQNDIRVALGRSLQFKLPLLFLSAPPATPNRATTESPANKLRLRCSLWQNRLPVDALPEEGWMELELEGEDEWVSH